MYVCARCRFAMILAVFFIVNFLPVAFSGSELCLDCLKDAEKIRCNFPFCPLNSTCGHKLDFGVFVDEIPHPTLICKDESSLTFTWNRTAEMYHFIRYFNGNPNESRHTEITRCNHLTINGLNTTNTYSFYLFGILLAERQLYRSRKIVKQISKNPMNRNPVKNLSYSLIFSDNSYVATVKWEPGSDLSCFYEIVWYAKGDPGEYIHRRIDLKKEPRTEFNLTNLEFGEKYHFSIISTDRKGLSESPKKRLKILIPSCLDTFQNLTICPPNSPNNLSVIKIATNESHSNRSTLKLTWDLPKLKPTDYTVFLFTSNGSSEEGFNLRYNISGERNFAFIKDVELGKYYQIKLIAYSEGGSSVPAYIINHTLTTMNTSVINQTSVITYQIGKLLLWICIGTFSIILLIALIIVFRNYFKNILVKYLFFKEKIDDTIIAKYTTSESEDPKWELAESKLLIDKVIGFGAFGIVQKGYYYLEANKKTEVAVKTLKAKPTGEQIAQFYDEIEIMKSVPRHSHIIYLIGVVTKHRPSNPLMLVEYCARGDLQSFLRKVSLVFADSNVSVDQCNGLGYPKDSTKFFNKAYDMDSSIGTENGYILESKDLLSFARQIVLGMEFLSNLKVIHRDLAARNVLITENNTLKISDFGLSRDIYTDNIYKKVTGGKLPFRWMALESLTHQVYTTESDVWSFGIILWEIVTLGDNPYPTINTENLVPLLKSGYRMEKPVNCSEDLYKIMINCWHSSPNLRANFKELREAFDKLLESEMQYISLESSTKSDENHYENIKNEPEGGFAERYVVPSSYNMI